VTWRGYSLAAVLAGLLVGRVLAHDSLAASLPALLIVVGIGWLALPAMTSHRRGRRRCRNLDVAIMRGEVTVDEARRRSS
jgi:hypothetical protein